MTAIWKKKWTASWRLFMRRGSGSDATPDKTFPLQPASACSGFRKPAWGYRPLLRMVGRTVPGEPARRGHPAHVRTQSRDSGSRREHGAENFNRARELVDRRIQRRE